MIIFIGTVLWQLILQLAIFCVMVALATVVAYLIWMFLDWVRDKLKH